MLTLGIESSCDETAAAVLKDGEILLSNVINSQILTHEIYGGVVPELASRKHVENIYAVVREALLQAKTDLGEIDLIAATQGPGLVGCLLVGHCFAKTLSYVKNIPCIGVDHITGHLLSVFLEAEKPQFPYIALVASGGHSSIFHVTDPTTFTLLGRTRDDAAGEAFDKVAKLLGLGYPGGPAVSLQAQSGNPAAIDFPRAMSEKDNFDFSFSGLKTAVANYVYQQNKKEAGINIADVCASFQEAAVDALVEKTINAALHNKINNVVLAGGVASNPRLRERFKDRGKACGMDIFIPSPDYCTDNAAMIAFAGYQRFLAGKADTLDTDVYSRSPFLIFP
ncbi:MAG: tRNA (adenosine(37)-N6)-threonylcarbamoyltransferase complex transferase subunit TsaD [Proteobacteria bacterium]|nr:tRNA (adenosine(37)-N6)-threonylcarbamoyltransferase complex transferase subunit TsaD [Pseudomonadota bacterium]MBU1709334.1 tRNA (adenosine(37)-N6)-threonylcarbamoyltransferase complex transferase subunit TsaD [Pseudomonadota bacterium]